MWAAASVVFVICAMVFCEVDVYGPEYNGRLTPSCVKEYHRILVSRRVPARNYLYYHETLSAEEIHNQQISAKVGEVEVHWRIVGGKQVSIREVPYAVMYGPYCGGTLLAPQWALTAAHCKEEQDHIYAGSAQHSLSTPYAICAHFTHPLWNSSSKTHSHDYDYQLLLLEYPVLSSPEARPIAIGSVGDVRAGVLVAVSGWGHLKYKHDKMHDYIRRVYVPIIDHEACRELPQQSYRNITPRMFCAGYMNGTKDSCQGDSGGPAVANGKLLGSVSFGLGCALPDQPGVYADVTLARDWIRAVTALPL